MKPEPGQCCPACDRRVPYPKTEKSPESRVFSYRVPLDEAEEYAETMRTCGLLVGAHGLPYWQHKTILAGLVRLLQDGVEVYARPA